MTSEKEANGNEYEVTDEMKENNVCETKRIGKNLIDLNEDLTGRYCIEI